MNNIDVKNIRERMRLTQDEFAKTLGVHHRTVQKWESGETKIRKANAFMIDEIYKKHNKGVVEIQPEYSESLPSELKIIDDSDQVEIFTNKNGNVFYEYPDGTIKIEVLKVPFPAYASYLEAYNDNDKLEHDFAKIQFTVDKIGRGNYLGFTICGDSMNGGGLYDTPDGAEVLAREISRHLWSGGFRKTDYGFILMTKDAIYHKDITHFDANTGMLNLSSRNPKDKDFEMSINDVYRIFNVIRRSF